MIEGKKSCGMTPSPEIFPSVCIMPWSTVGSCIWVSCYVYILMNACVPWWYGVILCLLIIIICKIGKTRIIVINFLWFFFLWEPLLRSALRICQVMSWQWCAGYMVRIVCIETKGPEGQGGPHSKFCDNTPESTSSHVKQGVSNYYSWTK